VGISHDLGLAQIRHRLPSPTRALRARSFPLRAPNVPGGVDPPHVPGRTGVDFDTDWARRWPARMFRAAMVEGPMRAMVQVLASPRRRGTDRLSELEGPVIFAANHHSHIDTSLLLTSIPEPWRHKIVVGAAADYFFGTRVAGTVAALAMGAIPIERTALNRRTIDKAVTLLRGGWSLVLYPEGGRSRDGWGQQFRPGAAFLAKQAGVPVVPVHIRGTFDILRKGRAWPRRARPVINFGRPLSFDEGENNRRFTRRLQAAVEGLADETATGNWFAARRRLHSADSPGLEGPTASAWRRRWALTEPTRPDETSAATAASKRRWPYV